MSFTKVKSRSIFSIHDSTGIKLLTRLRLGFSHLNEHKLWQNFRDTVSAMCDCGSELESTQHFLLRCPFFNCERKKLFESLHNIKPAILEFQKGFLSNIQLSDSDKFEETINRKILQSTITYLKSSSRFERPLNDQWYPFCFSEWRRENSNTLFGMSFTSMNDMNLFRWSSIKIPLKFSTCMKKTSEKVKYHRCAAFHH